VTELAQPITHQRLQSHYRSLLLLPQLFKSVLGFATLHELLVTLVILVEDAYKLRIHFHDLIGEDSNVASERRRLLLEVKLQIAVHFSEAD